MSDFPVRSEILRLFWMAYDAVLRGDKVEFTTNVNGDTLTATLHTNSGGPYPFAVTEHNFLTEAFTPEAIGFAYWISTQTQEAILDLKSFWGDPNEYSYWTRRDIMFRDERTGQFTDVHYRFDSTIEVDLGSQSYSTLTLGEVFTTAPKDFIERLVEQEKDRQQTDDNWESFLEFCLRGITKTKPYDGDDIVWLVLDDDFQEFLVEKEILISLDDSPFTGPLWDYLPLLRYEQEWRKTVEARWLKIWAKNPDDIPF